MRHDIHSYYNALHSAIDFIENNIDSDTTGLSEEMIPPLLGLMDFLDIEIDRRRKVSLNARVKRIVKARLKADNLKH